MNDYSAAMYFKVFPIFYSDLPHLLRCQFDKFDESTVLERKVPLIL